MKAINPYLIFPGTCGQAMRFYQQTLGGQLEMQTHADNFPAEQIGPGNADRIIHARLDIDGNILMASDDMAGDRHDGMHGFAVTLVYATAAESKRAFDALAEGGKVTMPFEQTFFSPGFGMLTDRFGTPWMVNTI